jgi:dCTP deaminase
VLIKTEEIIKSLSEAGGPYGRLRIVPSPSIEDIGLSGAASVDLRLGRWLLSLREGRIALLDIRSESTESSDDEGNVLARTPVTRTTFVPFGERFILHPRKFILGITLECISLPSGLGGYVTGKSSWGRRGLVIETASGIHPGFSGCLTLELANMGEVPIALIPGRRICQIFLHSTSGGEGVHGGQFLGRRRPTLGELTMDPVVESLRKRL